MKDIAKLVDVSIATVYCVLQRVDDKFKLDDEGGPRRGEVDEEQARSKSAARKCELFSQVERKGPHSQKLCDMPFLGRVSVCAQSTVTFRP